VLLAHCSQHVLGDVRFCSKNKNAAQDPRIPVQRARPPTDAGMGGPGSGRPKGASKAPRLTLASLAAVVEAQRGEIVTLRERVATLEVASAAEAGGSGPAGDAECLRNVRRKTTIGSAPATTLETLPRDALHAIAAHLGVEDQARLIQSCKVRPGRYCPARIETHFEPLFLAFTLHPTRTLWRAISARPQCPPLHRYACGPLCLADS
jgi:hypothetical protein